MREECRVSVNHVEMFIRYRDQDHIHKDDPYNYVNNYLQWYFVILQLQDTIHEGDITRTNIILKTIIQFFIPTLHCQNISLSALTTFSKQK